MACRISREFGEHPARSISRISVPTALKFRCFPGPRKCTRNARRVTAKILRVRAVSRTVSGISTVTSRHGKLLQPGLLVMLFESYHTYRQIFTDGRPLPDERDPAWF